MNTVGMALPTEVPMPSYIIYRDGALDQPIDPTAPLVFWPAKDSDELFDALRAKYPHLRAHSERMREAVIEFLMEERQMPEVQPDQLQTPMTTHSTLTSPWQTSMPSMSSESSTWSSPELFDLATPTFGNSPQSQVPQLSRQLSTATSATASGNPTPPALENMTGVFSLSDAAQPKQRVRRKMTEAEKVEYRKRRIVKACDKCAKRKRKCQHNQPEMETVGPMKPHKITKPATPTSRKSPSAPALPQIHEYDANFGADTMDFIDSFSNDVPIQQPTDYSVFVEEDLTLDELLASAEPQWPWSDTQDWTLMDTGTIEFATTDLTHKSRPQHQQGVPRNQPDNYKDQYGNYDGLIDPSIMQFSGNESYNSGNGMLWEHLRTGQLEQPQQKQQPTHTAHVHDAEGAEMFIIDESLAALQGGSEDDPQTNNANVNATSLAQLTWRLTGTRKAVKAFGNLLQSSPSRRSRLRSTSLRKVAMIALGGLSQAQQQLASPEVTRRPSWGLSMNTHQQCDSCFGTFEHSKDLDRHMQTQHYPSPFDRRNATDLLDGMSMEDYLRMQTNQHPIEEDGRATVSITPQPRNWPVKVGVGKVPINAMMSTTTDATSKGLGANPSPGSNGNEVLQHLDSNTQQQGRQIPSSLGEGIATSKSPSTELFMLKRRMPKALHSEVDRNSPCAVLGPLLTTAPTAGTEDTMRLGEGGAYPSLLSQGYNKTVFADVGSGRTGCPPVFTAGSNTTAQAHASSAEGITSNHLTDTWKARGPAPASVYATASGVLPNSPTSVVWEDRLSDHMRRRDHFGRSSHLERALETLVSSVALLALLALLSLVPTNTVHLSLLLLALASPIQGAKRTHHAWCTPFPSNIWATIVRLFYQNNPWLAAIDPRVQNHQPARTFVLRMLNGRQNNGTTARYKDSMRGRSGSGKKHGPCAVVAVV